MRTDNGMGGQGSLWAPLNPPAIDLVGIPYVDTKGCHLSGYVTPLGLGDRLGSFGFLGYQAQDCSSRDLPVPLGWRWADSCGRFWPGHGLSEDVIQALSLQSSHHKLHLLEALGLKAFPLPPQNTGFTQLVQPLKKEQEMIQSPKCDHGQGHRYRELDRTTEKEVQRKIPGQVVSETHSPPTPVNPPPPSRCGPS